jgi:hypothetical protein
MDDSSGPNMSFNAFLKELMEDEEETPGWAMPILAQIADKDAHTYDLHLLRAKVRLVKTIMAETGQADIEIWAGDDEKLPDWARVALRRFLSEGRGFGKHRLIAECDTLIHLISTRLGFDD